MKKLEKSFQGKKKFKYQIKIESSQDCGHDGEWVILQELTSNLATS